MKNIEENELFEKFKPKMIIRPSLIKDNLKISLKEAYEICEKRKDTKSFMFIICPHCKCEANNTRYYTVNSLPGSNKIECGICKKNIENVLENAYVFYEKI